MDIITAVVEPAQLPAVNRVLGAHGLEAVTSEPAEIADHTPRRVVWRGSVQERHAAPAVRLEIPYWDLDADRVADEILEAALAADANHGRCAVWVCQARYHGQAVGASLGRIAHPAATPR